MQSAKQPKVPHGFESHWPRIGRHADPYLIRHELALHLAPLLGVHCLELFTPCGKPTSGNEWPDGEGGCGFATAVSPLEE